MEFITPYIILNQCQGRFLGIISWYPSVCRSNQLHVDILQIFYINEAYSINSSKVVGNSPKVSNFNQFILKLNRFICNQLSVLPDHCFETKVTYCVGPILFWNHFSSFDAIIKKRPYLWPHIVSNFQGMSAPCSHWDPFSLRLNCS
jgi:hypothetical protein